jgi:GT2 family glycosyltransferase
MNESSTATVVIPTNRPDLYLREVLESLARQDTQRTYEVIVVDDASGSDLSPLLAEFGDLPLKVISFPRNLGRSAARNAGVQEASGDIIIFLDDDMTVVPGFVGSHLEMHSGGKTAAAGDIVPAPEYAGHPLARYIQRQGARKRRPGRELPPQVLRTGNCSLPRRLFLEVGMFDESFRTYGEDLDLAMRLSYAGTRFLFARGAVSVNHDPPDLEDMIEKVREWGRHTLPIFMHTHPRLARHLWVHLGEPLRPGREPLGLTLRKAGLRMALIPPFYAVARALYRLRRLGPLLFPVIDYIRVYNYIREYRSVRGWTFEETEAAKR